jgi:hypothetical protein
MTSSVDELMLDAQCQQRPYPVEVACSSCGDAAVVQFCAGEPVNPSSLDCHCGGEFSPV